MDTCISNNRNGDLIAKNVIISNKYENAFLEGLIYFWRAVTIFEDDHFHSEDKPHLLKPVENTQAYKEIFCVVF